MSPSEAESHKLQGNIYFGQQLYDEAIREYSTAIIKNPNNPVYYTNRAICFLRTHQFDKVIADCERATELNVEWVKGYYLMGQALAEIDSRVERAITTLRKAYDLSIQQRVTYSEEIANAYRQAKKKKWEIADKKRRSEQSDLHSYLTTLMEEERKRRVEGLEGWERERVEYELVRAYLSFFTETVEEVNIEANFRWEQNERTSQIQTLFNTANDESAKRREVPDYYCGKISFEIMMDPVVTPSGITYDRTEIRQHLNKIGQFDPLSRKPLREEDLVANLSLKEAIDDFLDQ
ncbi:STIP1 y and U box-containing protein 1 [Rhizophlyctis rosea]|uniref:E3 ubiquitin-protein ligase CHIP n=1 Tax=Rhizophlyctis rosea TaxID=64517 RepID=A0AAD5X2X1_9FUNG|nr:STIP1 y and U box-containing protein 1 [Rhizophlyctis rosea]